MAETSAAIEESAVVISSKVTAASGLDRLLAMPLKLM